MMVTRVCFVLSGSWRGGGGASICGVIVAGGARFCMKISEECTMESHAHLKGLEEELTVGKDGVYLFMAKPSPRLNEYAFFQPSLGAFRE